MKKVLVLSYYFPPCNLTPSERIYSWAKYLNECGIYPIIVTRNWDIEIKGFSDELKSSGDEPRLEMQDGYEVWYMPYKQSFKESLFGKQHNPALKALYLGLSFLTNILQAFTFRYSPMNILYHKANQLLNEDKSIETVIASAYPYALFEYSYLLHKKHGVNWVADYRDDWTSNEILNRSALHRFINYLNAFNEKKWLATASCFTTVSDFYVHKIQQVIGSVPGHCILNGYMSDNYSQLQCSQPQDIFRITYVGSLYHTQPIELFLDGVKKVIDLDKPTHLQITFVGLKNNVDAYHRVKNYIVGYESYYNFTDRVSKAEAIQLQYDSNMLLICTHTGMKGTPGSKLYEYIALKKLVMITPGDNDIVEETLKSTSQAIVATTADEVYTKIGALYQSFIAQDHTEQKVNEEEIKKYDRYYQALKLGEILNSQVKRNSTNQL